MNGDGAWNTNVTYNNFNGCEVLRLVGTTLLNKLKLYFSSLLFAVVVVVFCQMMMI